MKTIKLNLLFLLLAIFGLGSCDWMDEESETFSYVHVRVGDVYGEVRGEYLYHDAVDCPVYIFKRWDAENHGIDDPFFALDELHTNEYGEVIFELSSARGELDEDYVVVVYDYDGHFTESSFHINCDENVYLTMYATGEMPEPPLYNQPCQHYELVNVAFDELSTSCPGDRAVLDFRLPRNTVYWYFSYCNTDDMRFHYDYVLIDNLYDFFDEQYGTDDRVLNKLELPRAEGECNVFLMDYENGHRFLSGSDFDYIRKIDGKPCNVVEEFRHNQGEFCIGIENSNYYRFSEYAFVEVVAVVKN